MQLAKVWPNHVELFDPFVEKEFQKLIAKRAYPVTWAEFSYILLNNTSHLFT